MNDEPSLWRLAIDYLRSHPSTSHPTGVDRRRVEQILAELYVLGERPTVDDVRAYFDEQGVGATGWSKDLVRVWRDRLKNPTRRHRGRSGWLYPFNVFDYLVTEHGLRSVDARIVEALAAAAADYLDRAERDPAAPETRRAEELFVVTQGAVRLRAMAHDRATDDTDWPSIVTRYKTWYDNVSGYATRAGRARNPYYRDRE